MKISIELTELLDKIEDIDTLPVAIKQLLYFLDKEELEELINEVRWVIDFKFKPKKD